MYAVNNVKETVCREFSEGFAGGCDAKLEFIVLYLYASLQFDPW